MKLSEMREKTVEELKQFVLDSKKALMENRIKLSMHKLENTAEISAVRSMHERTDGGFCQTNSGSAVYRLSEGL